jgi:stage II sporulation protein P
MYTYRRNFRLPPVNRNKKRAVLKTKDRTFYIRAALYVCIAAMLAMSVIFVNRAAVSAAYNKQIAFLTEGQPKDASGYDDAFQDSLIDPELILSQEMPVVYGVNLEEVDLDKDNDSNADIYFDVLPDDVKLEILKFSNEPKEFYVGAQGPQILIYHTHTEEAYRQVPGGEYADTGDCHTKDLSQTVVAVGEELKAELEKYGLSVLHDTTDHQSSDSYSKSLATMEKYAEQYPTLSIFIDVHRDSGKNQKDYVTIKGENCARTMFVVGTGKSYTGTGYDAKPNYESNYKLALAITNELERIKDGFTRPIRVKTGRYNQHVSDMCLLIEVGHNANTLEQAKNSAKYVALALSRVVEISGP